jgi:hypothetical protein
VKSIRRSPVFRVACWLLTLALILPMILIGRNKAEAQGQQLLKVIVADIENKSPGTAPNLGINATAAVYNELGSQGIGKFFVFDTKTVMAEAQNQGIRVPSVAGVAANFSQSDLVRIAKALGADGIVRGEVLASQVARNRPVAVTLDVRIFDIASQAEINGGYSTATASPRPGQPAGTEELLTKAVQDAALSTVRSVVQHQLVTATVLNVNDNVVILNRGTRDGLKVGDDITVFHEGPNGDKVQRAVLHAVRVFPDNTEAEITNLIGGVQVEDFARVIYRSPIVITATTVHPAPNRATFSLAAVGATLSVIGLGVVVATAVRGGQASVTAVTAESGSENGSPIVRLRWSDNIFGQAGVQQYKIYRLPDFPFGTVGGNNGGNGGGNNNAAGVPVGTGTPVVREFFDHPSPFFPYANGNGVLVGNSNGGLNGGSGNSGNGNNTNQTCGVLTPAATLDTGFRVGNSYRYQITAVILRQPNLSGTGNNGNIGGNGGTGGGNGGNNGNTSGGDCIETDPSQSGLATPINPVIQTTPTNQTGSVDITQFTPTFTSRSGADIYQLEISTDRTFKNASLIFRQTIISTAPNSDGVTQTVPQPINLTTVAELLRDPIFANFVTSSQGSNPQLPTIYWRVGARHDEDVPGPIHWISQNAGDSDRTFRFVYGNPFSFTPAPVPPAPPGRAAQLKNSVAAAKLNQNGNGGRNVLPLPGDTLGRGSLQRVLTPQEILTGARGRTRH